MLEERLNTMLTENLEGPKRNNSNEKKDNLNTFLQYKMVS